MKSGLRVGIVGAGVGGLTAAAALRVAGAEPTVLERASDLRHVQVGGSFHLWPNALRALGWAGLYDSVMDSVDVSANLTTQTFETDQGKRLIEWPLDRDLDLPTLAVVRGDIHRVLAREANIRLDAGVERFNADGKGVTVHFTNGESDHFDVLIGADGLHSKVREGVLGKSDPYYTGYTTWLAMVPSTDPYLERAIRVYFGKGGRFIAWPVNSEVTYWEGISRAPRGAADGPDGKLGDVLARYGDWVDPIRPLIEATRE